MKRKIILMGGKTHVISLPSKWIRKYELHKGEELDIKESENKIIVSTEKAKEGESIKLDIRGLNYFLLEQYLTTLYRLGYKEVMLTFDKLIPRYYAKHENKQEKETILVIKDILKDFIGFEIVQQTDTSCLIKEVSSVTQTEFDNFLRKLFLNLLTLSNESLNVLNKKAQIKLFLEKHDEVRRITNYCCRYLNMFGYADERKTGSYYEFVMGLYEISRVYRHIAKESFGHQYDKEAHEWNKTSFQYDNNVLDAVAYVNETLNDFYKLFYKFNKEDCMTLNTKIETSFKIINELNPKVNYKEVILLHRLPIVLNKMLWLSGTMLTIQS